MPIYPYRCLVCQKRFEIAIPYSEYGNRPVTCVFCGSEKVQRRVSRVRIAKSEESRLESLADIDNLDGIDEDPRALGQMMRKMSQEMGEDVGPEFHEVIDRLEAGQSPEEIEATLPDLGSGSSDSSETDDF